MADIRKQPKAFIAKVLAEHSLQEQLKAAADGGAGVAIAKAAGFSITTEELQILNNKASELSDDELEDIAGGA